MTIKTEENLCGGKGKTTFKYLLGEKELGSKCGMFAELSIEEGGSIGYHSHENESETYYITKGTGLYNDNGVERTVKAGDVTYAHNCSHGIANTGKGDLVFVALIIRD